MYSVQMVPPHKITAREWTSEGAHAVLLSFHLQTNRLQYSPGKEVLNERVSCESVPDNSYCIKISGTRNLGVCSVERSSEPFLPIVTYLVSAQAMKKQNAIVSGIVVEQRVFWNAEHGGASDGYCEYTVLCLRTNGCRGVRARNSFGGRGAWNV